MTDLETTIDHDTGEIIDPRAQQNLLGTAQPAQFLERATEHATALANVIRDRKLYKTIGQKNFVFVEGWTLLGSMLGVFPVLEEVVRVEQESEGGEPVTGWKATVAAKTRAGETVGRATALCMRSESLWKNRDEYAVCSMAQTRAVSKALRQPLGFIVSLAGYSATPAEEIPDTRAPAREPEPVEEPNLASAAQHARLNATLKDLQDKHPTTDQESWTQALKRWSKELGFPPSRKQWSRQQMSAAIEHVNGWVRDEAIPF